MRGGKKEAAIAKRLTMDFAFATVVKIAPVKKGQIFTKDNIWVKRPSSGEMKAESFDAVLGKSAIGDLTVDQHFSWSDINA